jgi:hypothetical protein
MPLGGSLAAGAGLVVAKSDAVVMGGRVGFAGLAFGRATGRGESAEGDMRATLGRPRDGVEEGSVVTEAVRCETHSSRSKAGCVRNV